LKITFCFSLTCDVFSSSLFRRTRKYQKTWYSDNGTGGGAEPQPTIAHIPTKPQQQQAQQGDLLGGVGAPAPAPPQSDGWDAFGGSSQQPGFANFDQQAQVSWRRRLNGPP